MYFLYSIVSSKSLRAITVSRKGHLTAEEARRGERLRTGRALPREFTLSSRSYGQLHEALHEGAKQGLQLTLEETIKVLGAYPWTKAVSAENREAALHELRRRQRAASKEALAPRPLLTWTPFIRSGKVPCRTRP